MTRPGEPRSAQEEKARADLDALSKPDDVFTSATARAARHMGAADVDRDDPAELWGTRMGRALSLAGVLVLAWMLGRQLGWW